MSKLTTDKHEASRGLSATAELLVSFSIVYLFPCLTTPLTPVAFDPTHESKSEQCVYTVSQKRANFGKLHSFDKH